MYYMIIFYGIVTPPHPNHKGILYHIRLSYFNMLKTEEANRSFQNFQVLNFEQLNGMVKKNDVMKRNPSIHHWWYSCCIYGCMFDCPTLHLSTLTSVIPKNSTNFPNKRSFPNGRFIWFCICYIYIYMYTYIYIYTVQYRNYSENF